MTFNQFTKAQTRFWGRNKLLLVRFRSLLIFLTALGVHTAVHGHENRSRFTHNPSYYSNVAGADELSPREAVLQEEVTGNVRDSLGTPLAGVSILIKGTNRGTSTDADGRFRLQVDRGNVLVFRFVGYIEREVTIATQSTLNVVLQELASALDEIVVVGYGVQKRANLTGAVSSVEFDNDAMQSRATTNVSSLLSGLAAGVRVQQTNGLPSANDEGTISVRGVGSLNASQAPLVIVDGMVANINSVSPNDVASVSILKDAASAAIYGSRASNGVILITTKSGGNTDGKITFSYNNFIGIAEPSIMHDVVSNSARHFELTNEILQNSNQQPMYTQGFIDEWRQNSLTDPIGYPNTDWSDVLVRQNTTMNHNLSARGGNEKISFFSSVDYFNDNGVLPNTGFRRTNFRNNMTYKVNDWLRLGNNFTVISTKAEPATIAGLFSWWRYTTPALVPKHPDGRFGDTQTGITAGANNVVANAESARGETKNNQIQGKIFAVLTPFEGFSVTASYFADLWKSVAWNGAEPIDLWDFRRNEIIFPAADRRRTLTNTLNENERHIYDVFATYDFKVDKHAFQVLGGYNQEYYKTNMFTAFRRDLLSYDTPVLNAASTDPQVTGTADDFAMRSYFGRVNYNYDEKYLFEANLRYDGSSRFSPENRWGLFPSFSAGWQISREDFWEGIRNTVNDFKLRVSWGQLGNNSIGNYEWQNFYQAANYGFNNAITQGLRYNTFGNANITWETTDILNIGADIRLFNSFTIDVNYYDKFTHDILANLPIPGTNGGIGAPRFNLASVRNKGIETELRYQKNIGNVALSFGANFAYNKNRIEEYKGDFIEPRGTGQAWTEGHPIGVYWVREVDYIVQNQSQVDPLLANGWVFLPSTPGPGDFMYKDANGDNRIDDNDRVLIGNPIPLYSYGGSINARYSGFDFNMYVDGVGGWDKYLVSDFWATNRLTGSLWPTWYSENMWTPDNPNATIPKMYTNNPKNNQVSDFFLHSASFFRIRSLQLGYTLPETLTNRLGVANVRFFGNLENYFTFTSWPGQDPETDDQTYPLAKTMSFGLSMSF